MHEFQARGVLLDIEGTTSSIRFVYDVMFPYVREHLDAFLAAQWNEEAVQNCLPLLAQDIGEDPNSWLQGMSITQQQAKVAAAVTGMMDGDVKATRLKQLQGLIWKDGFHQGQMVAHLFEDVPASIDRWCEAGLDVRIYSSGSIGAQKLFFGHTVAGDLLDRFGGHYDTTTGPKREAESYQAIARDMGVPANEILFVSDVPEELDAAKQAGMQVALSVRPENHPVPDNHGYPSVTSFAQLEIA